MGISKIFSDIVGIKRTNDNNIQMPSNGDFSNAAPRNPQYNMDQNMMYQQQLLDQQQSMMNPAMNNQYSMNQQMNSQPSNPQYIPQPQFVPTPQSTMEYQKQIIEEKNSGFAAPQQQMIMPRRTQPVSRRHNNVPINYENGRQQQTLDFSRSQPVEYGHYQEPRELERINQDFQYYQQIRQQQVPHNYPVQQQLAQHPMYEYAAPQQIVQPQQPEQIRYEQYYSPEPDYGYQNYPSQAAAFAEFEGPFQQHLQQKRVVNVLPNQIAKEVRSEKMRVAIMMIIGLAGIVLASIFLAGYYKMVNLDAATQATTRFAGFSFQQIPFPFVSIVFLIVAAFLFFLGATDYSLLYANVKKYERDLIAGKESIPYFITRNYRNILSRGVYVTWICFATYIVGAICLGVLYGLQGLYDSGSNEFYILFWRVGRLKSFKSDITINIIVLIATLFAHITNIIWSRSRKNNVIGYYGAPIVSSDEEKTIKKRANKICIIVTCVVLAIVLFAVAIPWAILRRRRGKSILPFGGSSN